MQNQPSFTSGIEQSSRNRKIRLIKQKANQIQNAETSKPFIRLKSNHEQQKNQTTSKLPIKPRSSIGRRPASSRKPTQTLYSATTTCSGKSQQQVKQAINTVFAHSKKLHTYLQQKSLDQQKAHQTLMQNQLFTLSLVSMVSNKSMEEATKYVQRSCIHKLDRIVAMQKQKKICESIESKIGQLIDKRIKALSQFS